MKTIAAFILITSALICSACQRYTFDYTSTKSSSGGAKNVESGVPDYTVQPKLNQPAKTQ